MLGRVGSTPTGTTWARPDGSLAALAPFTLSAIAVSSDAGVAQPAISTKE
jgi:hypothetical protein